MVTDCNRRGSPWLEHIYVTKVCLKWFQTLQEVQSRGLNTGYGCP
jgi:hypothetical protein